MLNKQFSLPAKDGLTLRGRAWLPSPQEKAARAVVWIVHGFGEHCGRYQDLANRLMASGFVVIGYDHRGHGLSDGKRGCAPHYDSFLDDLNCVREQVAALDWYQESIQLVDGNHFVWAHSFGGGLALNYLLRAYAQQASLPEFKGYLIASPWLKLANPPSRFLVRMAWMIHKVYPAFVLASKLDPLRISADPSIQKAYRQELEDPEGLLHGLISYPLFSGAVEAGLYALEHAHLLSSINVPIRLVHGGMDQVTSAQASCQLAQTANQGCPPSQLIVDLVLRSQMRHETHHEIGKEQLIDENIDWLERLIHQPQPKVKSC